MHREFLLGGAPWKSSPAQLCLFALPPPTLFKKLFQQPETAQMKGAGILCITGREMNLFSICKGRAKCKISFQSCTSPTAFDF